MARVISKVQVSDPGPSMPSCFIFMLVAINGTILNPAISPKIKIWTAAIIINFIVKHHVLQTYQCRVLHENIKNHQYVCFPNDSRYNVIKNVSMEYIYRR